MKYLQRPSANHRYLYYQRPWPKELVVVAKQHGYGAIYRTKLDVKPDSPDVDKAIAKSAEDKRYEQLVGRLESIPVVGTGFSINLNTGRKQKTRITTQPTTPPISNLLSLFHAKFKPESGKALRDRQKYWNEFLGHMLETASPPTLPSTIFTKGSISGKTPCFKEVVRQPPSREEGIALRRCLTGQCVNTDLIGCCVSDSYQSTKPKQRSH